MMDARGMELARPTTIPIPAPSSLLARDLTVPHISSPTASNSAVNGSAHLVAIHCHIAINLRQARVHGVGIDVGHRGAVNQTHLLNKLTADFVSWWIGNADSLTFLSWTPGLRSSCRQFPARYFPQSRGGFELGKSCP